MQNVEYRDGKGDKIVMARTHIVKVLAGTIIPGGTLVRNSGANAQPMAIWNVIPSPRKSMTQALFVTSSNH